MSRLRPGFSVPADRLMVPLERYISDGSSLKALSRRARIDPRHVRGIRSGDRKFVTIDVADKLLVAAEASWLWTMPPELGGFSDVYFHPAAVGGSDAS